MGSRRGVAVAIGLVMSLLLYVAAVDRHPQGDITRAVPFVLAALLLWAVVFGIMFGPRRGSVVALLGGAGLLLAASLYVVFVQPIDYAECETLFSEFSNEPCRSQSELGRAVLLLGGAACCAALGIAVSRRREQIVQPARSR